MTWLYHEWATHYNTSDPLGFPICVLWECNDGYWKSKGNQPEASFKPYNRITRRFWAIEGLLYSHTAFIMWCSGLPQPCCLKHNHAMKSTVFFESTDTAFQTVLHIVFKVVAWIECLLMHGKIFKKNLHDAWEYLRLHECAFCDCVCTCNACC